MTYIPDNSFVNVPTYQKGFLGSLRSINPWFSSLNTRYKDFTNGVVNNLGPSVLIELPPLVNTRRSLVSNANAAQQRFETLTLNEPISSELAFTTEQIIENNAVTYMKTWGEAIVNRIGTDFGAIIASHALTDTYRFFGDGNTPINTRLQLAQIMAFFRNYGSADGKANCYLSDMMAPGVVNSDLNQFVMRRNEEEASSWEIGESSNARWMISNLLTEHIAGTEGQNVGHELTVLGVSTNSDGAVTAITFSGTTSASDPDCIKENDKLWFIDNVSGQPNMRYMVWNTTVVSRSPVQFRATADCQSNGSSQVTVPIYPPLQAAAGNTQNINHQIQVGMKVKVVNSRLSGLVVGGDAFYLAMPPLPDQQPFATANEVDPVTNLSIRMTYGSKGPGTNFMGFVFDGLLGAKLISEYGMEICIPLNTGASFF
jgi:hypothetical protein